MSEDVRIGVREHYARAAAGGAGCCGGESSSCCGGATKEHSIDVGYTAEELARIPQEAILGLGCGNPTAIGALRAGETVLDLGSGGGIDCFLAARRVGSEGRVIGVDMTPEMIDRARGAASSAGFENVEFRLGEIEHLPMADESCDVVVSNCVINLSPDKSQVFREAYRVLKKGGRLMVSDIVTIGELPEGVRNDPDLYAACVSGAVSKEEYLDAIGAAGFGHVEIVAEATKSDAKSGDMALPVTSVNVLAEK
jgi:SAM-dependent methyltransferase